MKHDQSSIVGYDRGVRDVDVKKSVEGVIRELVIKLELVGSAGMAARPARIHK